MEAIIWLLYTALLVLNFLDYSTTHSLLTFHRQRERRWWLHERNPIARAFLRKWDLLGLAALKGIVMGGITISLATNPFASGIWGWAFLLFMIDFYVVVVAHNIGGMIKCRLAPFAK